MDLYSGDLDICHDDSFGDDDAFDITWKIHDILPLQETIGFFLKSPSFCFKGASWELRMYPFGAKKASIGNIDLAIKRLNSQVSQHYVFYTFIFKSRLGELKYLCDNQLFKPDLTEPEPISYMKTSFFDQMKDSLAPDGNLTILCNLRDYKISRINRRSPLESAIDASHCTSPSLPQKVLDDFQDLFLKQEHCDITIKVKGVEFRTHRAILIARSPVFASTFSHDMKEKSIDIEDCDPSYFSDFLCFLYCGRVLNDISLGNVYSLLDIAYKYDVTDLRLECLKFMKNSLTVDNFCDVITVIFKYSENELLYSAIDFYVTHRKRIILTDNWLSFLDANPKQANVIMSKAEMCCYKS